MSWVDVFKPSYWLKHKLLSLADRARGAFYEGAQPPTRLEERVKLFAAFNPRATPADWQAFALRFGQNCYREGFVRGYGWLEREWDWTSVDPDQVAEREAEVEAHEWTVRDTHPELSRVIERGYDLNDPLGGVSLEERQQFANMLASSGRYPVHVDMSAYMESRDSKEEKPWIHPRSRR